MAADCQSRFGLENFVQASVPFGDRSLFIALGGGGEFRGEQKGGSRKSSKVIRGNHFSKVTFKGGIG